MLEKLVTRRALVRLDITDAVHCSFVMVPVGFAIKLLGADVTRERLDVADAMDR